MTLTDLVSEPNGFVQCTEIVLGPGLIATGLPVAPETAEPATWQVVSLGIALTPFTAKETITVDAEVQVSAAGATMLTIGTTPRLTVIVDGALSPNSLLQTIEILLAPIPSGTLIGLAAIGDPLRLQVTVPGPLTL